MKAAFLVSPERFEIREVPEPLVPEDGIVLKVKACGVCGSDLRRWREGPPRGVDGIVPGHEAAGVIVEIGKNSTEYSLGDHLAVAPDVHCGRCYYCRRGMYNLCDDLKFVGITPGYPGGFAEKLVLTREILENGIVHKMPDGMPFKDAALAEPCCSVLACHEKAATGLHDTVAVIGAGPIGCLHVVIAKARGAKTIVSETRANRREMMERFRPDAIIDPGEENIVARVRELTSGLGADLVICANPIASTQTEAVEMVRKAGRVVLFGGLPKSAPMTSLDSNRIHYGEIEVVGAFSYHPTVHASALDLIHRNVIPADQIITHTFSLNQVSNAFEAAASGEGLKIVVEM
ncbi:MAG: alcohol dehydrogenase catalytic domain-containing protein [bacterium]